MGVFDAESESLGFSAPDPLDPDIPAVFTSAEVGLFVDGVLTVGPVTVTTSDPLIGSFRFATVSPVELTPGTTYSIIAGFPTDSAFGYANSPAFTYHPSVTYTELQSLNYGTGGTTFPTALVGNPESWSNQYQSVSFLLCD